MAGQVLVPALGCVFLGASAGFLIFNFPPARIFMGDAGSLVVGYMLATVSVLTTYFQSGHGTPPYALAMPLVILAIPLYDFTSVVIIRLLEGRNPMKGDQRHFSHRLVERGLSRRFAVLTIYLATATTGLAATLLPGAESAANPDGRWPSSSWCLRSSPSSKPRSARKHDWPGPRQFVLRQPRRPTLPLFDRILFYACSASCAPGR